MKTKKKVVKKQKEGILELEQLIGALARACRVKPDKLAAMYKEESSKVYWVEFLKGLK